MKKRSLIARLNNIVKYILKKVFKIFAKILSMIYGIKVEGKNNIPKGSYIIVANHVSAEDPIFIIGNISENARFISKESVNRKWWGKVIGYIFDIIFVARNGKDFAAVRKMEEVLEQGGILGIFPEGTRRGIIKGRHFKNTIISIAAKNNVRILPVAIENNVKVFGKTKMIIGRPISYGKYENITKEESKFLAENLEQKILEMINYKGYEEYIEGNGEEEPKL